MKTPRVSAVKKKAQILDSEFDNLANQVQFPYISLLEPQCRMRADPSSHYFGSCWEADTWAVLSCALPVTSPPYSIPAL